MVNGAYSQGCLDGIVTSIMQQWPRSCPQKMKCTIWESSGCSTRIPAVFCGPNQLSAEAPFSSIQTALYSSCSAMEHSWARMNNFQSDKDPDLPATTQCMEKDQGVSPSLSFKHKQRFKRPWFIIMPSENDRGLQILPETLLVFLSFLKKSHYI